MASSPPRWLIWTGPVFTVLFAVVAFGLEGSTPGEKASAQKVLDYYNAHQGRTVTEALLGPLAAALIIVFFSSIRSLARENESAGLGPTVLISGAVLWAGGLLFGSVAELMLAGSAHHGQAQVAQTANVLNNDSWIPFIGGVAVTLIGAGITVLTTRVLPVWLGWIALIVGIASLIGPGGFLGFFVAPLWMLVAGVLLGLRTQQTAPA